MLGKYRRPCLAPILEFRLADVGFLVLAVQDAHLSCCGHPVRLSVAFNSTALAKSAWAWSRRPCSLMALPGWSYA